MPKVLIVGHTPPPYGGQAIMVERLLKSQMSDVEMLHVPMRLSAGMNEFARFRIRKLFSLLAMIARIIYVRIVHRVPILYYAPAGPCRLTMFRDFAILLSTRFLFKKTIFHFHSSGISELYDTLPPWQRWLYRRAYFHVDAAVRLSELTPQDGRVLRARHEYIVPYGIDDPAPQLVLPRELPAITPTRPLRVLFVGILCESKGLLDLVEACGKLAAGGVPFSLEIMGSPDSEAFVDRVRRRITELRIEPQVRFLGVLTGREKFATFAGADVFCLPSFYENEAFPVVLIEAMASALPVVSTYWRGIPSMVDDGETGSLVESHDVGAVADRLARLAQDPVLRQRMAAGAREKFLRQYTTRHFIENMRNVFLEVAGEVPQEVSYATHDDSSPRLQPDPRQEVLQS